MKTLTSSFAALFLGVGLLSASPITVTADLTSAGANPITDSKGYIVGPYSLSINGVTYAAMCVDFSDEGKIGKTYSAFESTVGGNIANTYNPQDSTQYKEEAYLMSLLVQPNADRVDIQDAAWAITDSQFSAGSSAQYYENLAAKNYSALDFTHFAVISDVNQACGRSQEYMIQTNMATPEPASLFLLGGGLVIAGLARRKMRKAQS